MYSEPTTDNHNKSKYRIRTWSWTPTDELTGTESGQDKGSDRPSFLNPIFTIEASFELEIKGPLFFYQEWNESTPHPIPRRESEVLSANIPWIKCFHNQYRHDVWCVPWYDQITDLSPLRPIRFTHEYGICERLHRSHYKTVYWPRVQ